MPDEIDIDNTLNRRTVGARTDPHKGMFTEHFHTRRPELRPVRHRTFRQFRAIGHEPVQRVLGDQENSTAHDCSASQQRYS